MTGRPVLGDFLSAAHQHLDGSAAWTGTGALGRDIEEVTSSMLRIITVIGRSSGDSIKAFGEMSDRDKRLRKIWPHAAADTLAALAGASAALSPQGAAVPPPGQAVSNLARRLDAAAVSLTAGRDLLQTHFAEEDDDRRHRSSWAPVIASPAMTQALLAEITSLGRRAASLGAGAPRPTGRSAAAREAARRLSLACQWLAQAAAPVQAAHQREPVSDADRELLYAIPASALPARRLPDGRQPVSDLCEAIITTSERASRAAWTAAGLEPGSPAISVTSWRRIAEAGTATSHHCNILLTVLANRAAQHGSAEASGGLKAAAADVWLTRGTWLRSARALREVTTDVRWRVSRAAAEAADLALLTGRLTYADPGWSLASGPSQPVRPAALLAPEPADVPDIMATVHHATDTLARLATANLEQTRGAARVRRILVPVRSLSAESGAPDSFAVAPEERIAGVLDACAAARTASVRTAGVMGDLAVALQAPSRVLVTARAATRARGFARSVRLAHVDRSGAAASRAAGGSPVDGDRDPSGPFEARLRDIGVTSSRFLRRAASVDRLGEEVIFEAATECLDRRTPPAAVGPIRTPGSDAPAGRVPAPDGGRAPHLQQRGSSAEQEPEAEP